MRADLKVDHGLAALDILSRDELSVRWQKQYGCPPPTGVRRELLVRAAAWHLQVRHLGGHSAEMRRRLRGAMANVEARFTGNGGKQPFKECADDHAKTVSAMGGGDLSSNVGKTCSIGSAAGDQAAARPKGQRREAQPGARLIRDWNGKTHVVDVIEGGYVFETRLYPSLTAIARKITGTPWSGPPVLWAGGEMIGSTRRSRAARNGKTTPPSDRAMAAAPREHLRCAIYTRKSSEEGLDQEFNSLDAQREACAAFIASQVGLGWKLVPDFYDDGGISGGTMDRPALQRLLQDIRDRKVDVVVVYKIDRLTRSLMDFSKIVDVFDASNVSFVSVTQQFNTTTSMGRLTLNVLLSFAQFEREVTAERIRDKIAASKQKGMWMGGRVPLGYRVLDRKLIVDEPDAAIVNYLFDRYLVLRSVSALQAEVKKDAALADRRSFTRGQLYNLLTNPIYIGKLRHHEQVFDGEQEGIIDPELFEQVQNLISARAPKRRSASNSPDVHLLTGILYDQTGDRLGPVHASRHGKRYRYYVSRRLLNGRGKDDATGWRIAEHEIERIVDIQLIALLGDETTISDWVCALRSPAQLMPALAAARLLREGTPDQLQHRRETVSRVFAKITLSPESIRFEVRLDALVDQLCGNMDTLALPGHEQPAHSKVLTTTVAIERALVFKRRGVEARLLVEGSSSHRRQPDQGLIELIARAHFYLSRLTDGSADSIVELANQLGIHRADISRVLPLAFLSPSIVSSIFSGRQPIELNMRTLSRAIDIPPSWADQSRALGM